MKTATGSRPPRAECRNFSLKSFCRLDQMGTHRRRSVPRWDFAHSPGCSPWNRLNARTAALCDRLEDPILRLPRALDLLGLLANARYAGPALAAPGTATAGLVDDADRAWPRHGLLFHVSNPRYCCTRRSIIQSDCRPLCRCPFGSGCHWTGNVGFLHGLPCSWSCRCTGQTIRARSSGNPGAVAKAQPPRHTQLARSYHLLGPLRRTARAIECRFRG